MQQFLLKGALLFLLYYDVQPRPTRDIDLLRFGQNNIESMKSVCRDILQIENDDEIESDAKSVTLSLFDFR